MATKTEEKTQPEPAQTKHVLSILDKDGRTKPENMMELNKSANGMQMGKVRKHKALMKQVTDVVSVALKRA